MAKKNDLLCKLGMHKWKNWTTIIVAPENMPYRKPGSFVYQPYRECIYCNRIEEFERRDGWRWVYRDSMDKDWSIFE